MCHAKEATALATTADADDSAAAAAASDEASDALDEALQSELAGDDGGDVIEVDDERTAAGGAASAMPLFLPRADMDDEKQGAAALVGVVASWPPR